MQEGHDYNAHASEESAGRETGEVTTTPADKTEPTKERRREQAQPSGTATFTAKSGTSKPQAEKTGEPEEPARTQTRRP